MISVSYGAQSTPLTRLNVLGAKVLYGEKDWPTPWWQQWEPDDFSPPNASGGHHIVRPSSKPISVCSATKQTAAQDVCKYGRESSAEIFEYCYIKGWCAFALNAVFISISKKIQLKYKKFTDSWWKWLDTGLGLCMMRGCQDRETNFVANKNENGKEISNNE